jgi:hypothetical protein
MRTPVWEDENIELAVLDEGDEWTQSAFVRIGDSTTSKALERGKERMGNVQYLRVTASSSNESVLALLEATVMPNLRALWISVRLEDQLAACVANMLRNNPQLEQVQLRLQVMSGPETIGLLDAMSVLPLTALNLTFWDYLSQQSIDRFCALLERKRNTLVSLEVDTWRNIEGLVNGIVSKGLHGLQSLRLLRLHDFVLDELRMQDLCKALECMPQLATLGMTLSHAAPLTKFFSASFRRITALEIDASSDDADSHFTGLFNALKKNTRLRSLKLSDDQCQRVLDESGLVEEGFLTSVTDYYNHEFPESLLQRNRARRAACKCACLALISVRRKRGVLKWIAPDVVRMIAMWLWDTRNQSVWDAKPVAEMRQMHQTHLERIAEKRQCLMQ